MERRPSVTPDSPRTTHCVSTGRRVPQEHTKANDSVPRDWSQLGRRVLTEALRRATDELAARKRDGQTPVVPAPNSEDPR